MNMSFLKLKHYEICSLKSYYDYDDLLTDNEEIVDLIIEYSTENPSITTVTMILSKGLLVYIEYDLNSKKLIKFFKNPVLLSVISNSIINCDLTDAAPLLLSTSLNEIVVVDSKIRPQQLITLTEENVILYSSFCSTDIIQVKYNNLKESILALNKENIEIFKIVYNKIEMKNMLTKILVIDCFNTNSSNEFSNYLNIEFSFCYDNLLIASYVTAENIKNWSYKTQDLMFDINKNDDLNLYILGLQINKKDYNVVPFKHYKIDSTYSKLKFSPFNDKLAILYDNGIIMNLLNSDNTSQGVFNSSSSYKYSFTNNVKLVDLFFHHSSNFIIVKNMINDFFIFDYTLNVYHLLNNSKIIISFSPFIENSNSNNETDQNINIFSYKCWQTFSAYKISSINKGSNILNNKSFNNFKAEETDDFIIKPTFMKELYTKNSLNDYLFIYNKTKIVKVSFELSSNFSKNQISLNLIDTYSLIKNHLKGNNFESVIRILKSLSNTNSWIKSFLLLLNKLCQCQTNILNVKRHILLELLENMNQNFNDGEKSNSNLLNLKILAFSNLIYRCLSSKQYEYAFLIAEKLGLTYLYKLIVSHSKQCKYLGVAYLCCSKIEEIQNEADDSIINDINKIMTSSNFVLSQSNMQNMLRDIDQLLENGNLDSEYLKEHNTLDLNLKNYLEGLKMEMLGKFEEAKSIYKSNGLNYDLTRVEKLLKEIKQQISEDSIVELNDF